jgi:hypothetical protein
MNELVHHFLVGGSPRAERPRLRKIGRVFASAATPAVIRPIHAIRNVADTEWTITELTQCSNEYVHIATAYKMDG